MSNPTLSALLDELQGLASEQRNQSSNALDTLSTPDLLKVINQADRAVAPAVGKTLDTLAMCVDTAVSCIKQGGRLIYLGAGTSGRLGILDAVECRPTFSVPDGVVIGLIAGGEQAIQHAVEGAEDNAEQGKLDLQHIALQPTDMVVGIAASGRTPYVIGGLDYARSIGVKTACVTCNPGAKFIQHADIAIVADVGPEILTGSTRMKAGTAQKLILNTLSTATMVKLGKTFGNLMVDVNATNDKLKARAIRIVMQATECSQEQACEALNAAHNQAKLAILMILTGLNADDANRLLAQQDGYLRRALDNNPH